LARTRLQVENGDHSSLSTTSFILAPMAQTFVL
jgi:hypothetical protein